MSEKTRILQMLKEEYDRWEGLLAGLDEAQITAPQLPAYLSIKDVIAHLWAWQQISVARMEAGLHDREPELPDWLGGLDPDAEENLETINARIRESFREKLWSQGFADWRSGFQRLLELGSSIPERDLLEPGRYPWMREYPLSIILVSSYNHHHEEHLQPLLAWLRQSR